MDYTQLTTTALLDHVQADKTATERELALLDRLLGAIDEINALTQSLARVQAQEVSVDVDP